MNKTENIECFCGSQWHHHQLRLGSFSCNVKCQVNTYINIVPLFDKNTPLQPQQEQQQGQHILYALILSLGLAWGGILYPVQCLKKYMLYVELQIHCKAIKRGHVYIADWSRSYCPIGTIGKHLVMYLHQILSADFNTADTERCEIQVLKRDAEKQNKYFFRSMEQQSSVVLIFVAMKGSLRNLFLFLNKAFNFYF